MKLSVNNYSRGERRAFNRGFDDGQGGTWKGNPYMKKLERQAYELGYSWGSAQ